MGNILTDVLSLLLHLLLSLAETEEVGEETTQLGPEAELRGGAGLDRDNQEEEEEELPSQV